MKGEGILCVSVRMYVYQKNLDRKLNNVSGMDQNPTAL